MLFLLAGRLRVLRGPARRAQAPLLVAAGIAVSGALPWLVWVSATGESAPTLQTFARAVCLLVPLGVALPSLTLVMEALVTPVVASEKSPVPTPVTLSLNVTVHETLVAFVGLDVTRLIDKTVGAVLSTS